MDVARLDLLRHYALQVEYALVSQILLVTNVKFVSQAFMDFPTAKVKIKPLKIKFLRNIYQEHLKLS